jgi:hypothetical protein
MPVGAIGGLNQNSGVVRAGDVPPDTKVQEIGSGGAGGGGCKCGKCGGGGCKCGKCAAKGASNARAIAG